MLRQQRRDDELRKHAGIEGMDELPAHLRHKPARLGEFNRAHQPLDPHLLDDVVFLLENVQLLFEDVYKRQALDVFGVHAVGGMCGALATGFLADPLINPNLTSSGAGGQAMADLCDWSKGHLLYIEQLKIVAFTAILSIVGTAICAYALKFTIGLRPTPEQEEAGLDLSDHGEEGLSLIHI